jgi:membrane protein CcdC involved in cytochrome C biogenesis
MQVHPVQQSWTSTAVTIGIIVIVMTVRMRRMGKSRPLKLNSLWIVPAIYLVVTALMLIALPPAGWVAIASLAALLVGAGVGWQRGKMMHIHVDPETHALNQKASPAAMVFLVGLILVRTLARGILGQSGSVSPAMLTDPLIAFALGMLAVTRLEMYLRAKKLLDQARAGA